MEPIEILADIIQTELELSTGQVMLSYEKWKIPTNPGLYVALSHISGKPIGNNNYLRDGLNDEGQAVVIESQEVTMNEEIQIDIMSFNSEAWTRKEEILQALRSQYSQQKQDENSMQIARLGGQFLNNSTLEATKMLNRFTIGVFVTSVKIKEKTLEDYYDKFPTEFTADGGPFVQIDPTEELNG